MKLLLPQIMNGMTNGEITRAHITEGVSIKRGTPLFEIRVDLSGVVQLDCPPISSYRLVAREAGTVDSVAVTVGDTIEIGSLLATFTSPREDDEVDRELRYATVQCADQTLGDLFG